MQAAASTNLNVKTSSSTSNGLDTLGVSVFHLKNIFLETEVCAFMGDDSKRIVLSKDSKIHEIENLRGHPGVIRQKTADTLCPIDGRQGAAYVHCLSREDQVGEATHMLSYSWGYTIGDVVDTLWDYCESQQLDPKRTYIWIDCLCINQHRVVEQKEMGETGLLNFEQEFPAKLKKIGHMLAMMAPWSAPVYLTRVWCIFELYTAITNACHIDVVMPPTQKLLLEKDLLGKSWNRFLNHLYTALSKTKVEHAQASFEKDRQKILQMVESSVGYAALNFQVNELLRTWVKEVLMELVERRENTRDKAYITFRNKIGGFMARNGDYAGALALHQATLSICQSLWGEEHQCSATLYSNIGHALEAQKNLDGAMEAFQSCLAIRCAVLGPQHPQTGTSHKYVGRIHQAKGNYQEALQEYQKCLQIKVAYWGTEHTEVANSHYYIGNLLSSMGKYDEALLAYRKCLTMRESILGKIHHQTALTHSNIGDVLHSKGDLEGALEEYRKCLAIQESVLRKDHPLTAQCYGQISCTYEAKGDYCAALRELRKCLAIQGSVLGCEHPNTMDTQRKVATLLEKVVVADQEEC